MSRESTDENGFTVPEFEGRWYWDNRNRKAYYPQRVDEDTITFVTVWHREEVADALATGAVEPVTETAPEWFDSVFDHIDSFRFEVDCEERSSSGWRAERDEVPHAAGQSPATQPGHCEESRGTDQ